MIPTNTATFENKQQDLTAFDASSHPLYVQALFDDELDITCTRIIYVISCTKSKKLFSCRGIAKMVGREKTQTADSINRLLNTGYLIKDSNNDYYLNSAICVPEVSGLPDGSVRQTGRKCPVYRTEVSGKPDNNIINNIKKNNIKNERESALALDQDFDDLLTEPIPTFQGKNIKLEPDEITIGSGRCRIAKFKLLALTPPEAEQVDKMLDNLNPEQITRILLHASSMAESSESRKAASRSFAYISNALSDIKKQQQNSKVNKVSKVELGMKNNFDLIKQFEGQ